MDRNNKASLQLCFERRQSSWVDTLGRTNDVGNSTTESGLYYYRARYYDPNAGRFLSEDPLELAGGIDFYLYVGNEPIDRDDPTGLYQTGSQVPLPINPSLDKLLKCMDNCTGANLFVTATSNGKHQDPGHTAGTSVDILPPPGVPGNSVFCCAGKCGAAWGIDEGPGGIKTKFTTGFNYHLQLVPPRHPRPGAPEHHQVAHPVAVKLLTA